ncbi:MAG: hypothetical protein QW227_02950, partial [Candidatus Aenigmatarchaeota archaeon]
KRINPAGFNMPEVDYLPQTVEEKLVVCVDKHFKGGILLKTEEYLNARKKKDLEYYRDFLETYIRGLCKEIEALAGRKCS